MKKYFYWHYFHIWPTLFGLFRNLAFFPFYYFSIPLHLKTFLAPWKRQQTHMRVGFHFDDFLSVVGFNFISRVIGAFIRFLTIIYGIFFMLVGGVIGLVMVVIWPLIPIISLVFYINKPVPFEEKSKNYLKKAGGNLTKLALILFGNGEGKFVAAHLGFDQKYLLKLFASIKENQEYDSFQKEIHEKTSSNSSDNNISIIDLFAAMAKTYTPFKNLLDQNEIKPEDLKETVIWYETLVKKDISPLFLDFNRIKNLPGIGSNWAYGYTVEFDKYATDLTRKSAAFPILLGREKEIAELERILIKTEANNALIVGEPGVARHRLVETLAHRILLGLCPPSLSRKRVLSLNMHSLLSSKPTLFESKGLASEILKETEEAGNIIAVIDDFDKFVSSGDGRIDLSDVFAEFAESSVGLIGITTPGAYHKFIELNSSVAPLFEKININSPTLPTVAVEMQFSIVPVLEKKYNITITYPAIKKAIEDSDRFISATPFPAKTIELLDQTSVFTVSRKNDRFLTAAYIDEFLSEKFHVSLGNLQKEEKDKLLNMENLLHSRVVNQEEAIHVIAQALRRGRLNVSSPNKPIGSFLFLGPTGVGKTETAKALASIYYGSEDNMIRFDMSQYQKDEGLERLIGSVKLGTPGELTSKLVDHPFSLLLLDEFEKSQTEIYNLFLTLTDEGYITDSQGKKVNAKNIILIATSNAGAEFIREKINEGINGDDLKKGVIEYVQREKIFSPELINRFDAVTVFTPLSEGHLKEVARLMLDSLNKRLIPKEISIEITNDLIHKLAVTGFDPQFGARSMKRAITEKIEDQIAQKLLKGEVKKGEKIRIEL